MKPMQNLTLSSLLLWLVWSPAQALESDRKQKITLDGGGCILRTKDNNTECPNGLTIKQGTMVIKGDYGLIHHKDRGIESVKMTGKPAHFEQKMDSGELMVIKANQMDYVKADEKIYLNGAVQVSSDMGVSRGEAMEINLLTQEISSLTDDPDQRFYMEIEPDDKQ